MEKKQLVEKYRECTSLVEGHKMKPEILELLDELIGNKTPGIPVTKKTTGNPGKKKKDGSDE